VRPEALDRLPESLRVCLDVREDIHAGREPLGRIMAAVEALPPDGVLVLRAPFEPVPLYRVLAGRGFAHLTERRAAGDWLVSFYRDPAAAEAAPPRPPRGAGTPGASPAETAPPPSGRVVQLDVRGLGPPLPMLRVLEAVEQLAPGERLEVLHDRRPMFLYPQLEARGLAHATDESQAGTVRIEIWREGPAA
jgi:uncharacterized protein (DUF2249 family)